MDAEDNRQADSTIQPVQLCRIGCMFPVIEEEEAVKVLKAVRTALSSVEGARVDFNLTDMPKGKSSQ
jgi:hypothetical protein